MLDGEGLNVRFDCGRTVCMNGLCMTRKKLRWWKGQLSEVTVAILIGPHVVKSVFGE